MKSFVFLLYCWILSSSTQCQAETLNCDYESKYSTSYQCNLMYSSRDAVDVTEIVGHHQVGKSDEDVKELQNWGSNFKSLTSIFCQKFKNLEYLKVQTQDIRSVDENSFENCKNLKTVNLVRLKLLELPEKLLHENSKLIHVYIWLGDLTTLHENFFKNQNQLENLSLERNELNFLPSKIFHPLVKLQELKLNNNKLKVLDPDWFVNLKSLNELYLERNQFSEVPGEVFKSLESLEKLWLSENKLNTLNPDSFDGLQNLKELYLNDNEISDLPGEVFKPLKNLEKLLLKINKLTVIHSESFGVHRNLIEIYFDINKIKAIDEKLIENTAVEKLSMWFNLCYDWEITERNDIKKKLQKCFDNYQTRPMVCGRSKTAEEDIINSFPWIAAVEKVNGEFLCTGTLVDSRKVVTVASCIQPKNVTNPMKARDIKVILGAYDLNDQNEDEGTAIEVQRVHVHPRWNSSSERFDSDIAVLVLDKDVTGAHVPACLPKPDSEIDSINNGFVVGFEKSESNATAINTSIHKNRACAQINPDIGKVSSFRTFCGTSVNGTCNIGIGSSLNIQHDGAFYLRGIVSKFVVSGTDKCAADSVTIFTNMLLYTDWINGI